MYIELKAFESEDSSPLKTKIQLNVGTPFSADLNKEIFKERLQPKKVRDLLLFIADDLIPRIFIKAYEGKFSSELKQLQDMRDDGGKKTWEEFYQSASLVEIAAFKEAEKVMLDKAIKEMAYLKMPDIQQFNFDELSPGALAVSTMTIVNVNVPPPKR